MAKDGNMEKWDGSFAALFGKSMFHNMNSADDGSIMEEYEFAEFGHDLLRDIASELECRIQNEIAEEFPKDEVEKVKQLIHITILYSEYA